MRAHRSDQKQPLGERFASLRHLFHNFINVKAAAALTSLNVPAAISMSTWIRLALIALFVGAMPSSRAGDLGWMGNDLHGVPCHGISAGYGPFDYNDPQLRQRLPGSPLELVESSHYTKHVQMLMAGPSPKSHSSNAANLDYTLRAFPNHHLALWTMIQWYKQAGRPVAAQSPVPPPECWLQRALAFRPEDAVVNMLYGIYLHTSGLPGKAVPYYKEALKLDPNLAEAHYNYGLLLTDRHQFKQAVDEARRAYDLGYPLPGLRQRLNDAGYTVDQATLVNEVGQPAAH